MTDTQRSAELDEVEELAAFLQKAMIEELPHARQYALALCKNKEDAEDLVQEAFARFISSKKSKTVKEASTINLGGYIKKTIRNIYIDQIRKAQKVTVASLYEEIAGENAEYSQPAQLIDEETPEEILEREESREELQALISKIPEDMRRSLYLHYMDDLSVSEIAEKMQRPKNTVKSDLLRAKQRLRKTMG